MPVDENSESEVPKVGVYVCECGINISAVVDCQEVVEYTDTLQNVVTSKVYKYMCSDGTIKFSRDLAIS